MTSLINRISEQLESVLDRNTHAQQIVTDYVSSYIRSRILLSTKLKKDLGTDKKYESIISFLNDLIMEYSYLRLWTRSTIETTIYPRLSENQDVLEFVYKGTSLLQATLLADDIQLKELCHHLADSLSCMSSTESSIIPVELVDVLPHYQELAQLFETNRWLVFLYYVSRIEMASLLGLE